jgi:hypothetical protein
MTTMSSDDIRLDIEETARRIDDDLSRLGNRAEQMRRTATTALGWSLVAAGAGATVMAIVAVMTSRRRRRLPVQKQAELFEEQRPRRLVLEHQMVRPRQ